MNLNTTSFVRNVLKGALPDVMSTFSIGGKALEIIRRYRDILADSNQAMAALIRCLASDIDNIADDVVDLPDITDPSDYVDSLISRISDETGQFIDNSLSDVINMLGSDDNAMTIIDGAGASYCLKKKIVGEAHSFVFSCKDAHEIPFLTHNGEIWELNNFIPTVNFDSELSSGTARTLPSFISSLSTVGTLNELHLRVMDLLTTGRMQLDTLSAQLSEFVQSKIRVVKDTANTFISLFAAGGMPSVINYIIRELHAVGTAAADEQGNLVFTDNKSLIPQQFIGTLLAKGLETVGTILMFIGNVVVKIIGVGLQLGASIISFITSGIWGNYTSNTNGGIYEFSYDNPVSIIPEFPMAAFQNDVLVSPEIFDMLEAHGGIVIAPVPGGFLHIGKSPLSGWVRFEFHPHAFWTADVVNPLWAVIIDAGTQGYRWYTINKSPITYDYICDRWINEGYDVGAQYHTNGTVANSGANTLDNSSDLLMRKVCMRNTAIFMLFCSAVARKAYEDVEEQVYDFSLPLPLNGVTSEGVYCGLRVCDGLLKVQLNSNAPLHQALGFAFIPLDARYTLVQNLNDSSNPLVLDDYVDIPSWTTITSWFTNSCRVNSIALNAYGNGSGKYVRTSIQFSSGIFSYSGAPDNWSSTAPLNRDGACSSGVAVKYIQLEHWWMGNLDNVTKYQPGAAVPTYDATTFWAWVALAGVITVVAAIGCIAASVLVKRAITRARIANASKVEAAWANAADHPGDKSYAEAYRKTAKKANLMQKVIGGTTYDVNNYWGDTSSDEATTVVNDKLNSVIPDKSGMEVDNSEVSGQTVQDVILLIKGV